MAKGSGGGGRLTRVGSSVDVIGRNGGINVGSGTVVGRSRGTNIDVLMENGRTYTVPRNALAPRGSVKQAEESNRALRRSMFATGATQAQVRTAMERNTAKILRRRNP